MRSRRLVLNAAAVWLAVLALALNALVPIHLTFDLVAALDQGRAGAAPTNRGSAERRFLAALSGHHQPHDKSGGHGGTRHTDCLVCNSLNALGGAFAPPVAAAALRGPSLIAAPPTLAAMSSAHASAPTAAYFSRAPPLS